MKQLNLRWLNKRKLIAVHQHLTSILSCSLYSNHRQLVRYEKNALELCRYAQKNNISKNNLGKKNAFLRAELHLKFSDQLIGALIGGEIFSPQNGSCRVSKCPSFCVDFKNVNLP
jgi:hypothetical protein